MLRRPYAYGNGCRALLVTPVHGAGRVNIKRKYICFQVFNLKLFPCMQGFDICSANDSLWEINVLPLNYFPACNSKYVGQLYDHPKFRPFVRARAHT